VPAWRAARAARERDAAGGAAVGDLRALRGRLCALLAHEPARYDLGRLLAAVAHTELWDEQVVLHQKARARSPDDRPTCARASMCEGVCSAACTSASGRGA